KPAGSGSLKNKSHFGLDELNALDLLSPPCGNGLALLDKVLATCSINESSPNVHVLFVASRTFNEPDPAGSDPAGFFL
ncbi:hypothetical protein, partial [Paraglaciecola arctica]|uniref:hypothetical protein n=1 Tax=Paraglaciecola arctica TaxID=1128911 RepID=UPI000587BC8A